MSRNKEGHLNMLDYFWHDKGDPQRYCDYDEAIAMFPDIKSAWENYKTVTKQAQLLMEHAIQTEWDKISEDKERA